MPKLARPLARALAALLLLTAGCKGTAATRLEGRWRGVRAEGVPTEAQASANAFAAGTEIVVRGNQLAILTPGARPVSATYVVDKDEGADLVLHTDRDRTIETFTFADAKTMVWKVDARRSIVFRKTD